jgi:hypothetical protein
MRYIKLAQKLAQKAEAVGVTQIFANGGGGNGACPTKIFSSLKSCYLFIKSPKK